MADMDLWRRSMERLYIVKPIITECSNCLTISNKMRIFAA